MAKKISRKQKASVNAKQRKSLSFVCFLIDTHYMLSIGKREVSEKEGERQRAKEREIARSWEMRPIPAINIVEVGEEKDSTDEESDQHESPIHFVK